MYSAVLSSRGPTRGSAFPENLGCDLGQFRLELLPIVEKDVCRLTTREVLILNPLKESIHFGIVKYIFWRVNQSIYGNLAAAKGFVRALPEVVELPVAIPTFKRQLAHLGCLIAVTKRPFNTRFNKGQIVTHAHDITSSDLFHLWPEVHIAPLPI